MSSAAHYHVYYDSTTDKVTVKGVSDEEAAHPYTPHGINTFFNVFGGQIPLSAPQQTFDYLGVPLLAPNYSFGIADYIPAASQIDSEALVAEIRREFHDPARPGPPPSATSLKTIASIEVVRRRYVITLAGIVPLQGNDDYDLHLTPLSDPGGCERYGLTFVHLPPTNSAVRETLSPAA